MKIYIHTDLEGVSGIDNIEMMARDHERHEEAVRNLMADLNAAVDGAFAGGADHVTVLDSHGGGGNFILDLLDERAQHDTKPNKKWRSFLSSRGPTTATPPRPGRRADRCQNRPQSDWRQPSAVPLARQRRSVADTG